jgi:D-lactate dehydrogenase (cytochrome)
MHEVVALHEEDLDIEVQAGLGYVELNDILRPHKLWFPLDPGPGASVGGMCACRCSGSTAVRYGSMRENVLNVTAVLADGTIIKTGSRARKSSAGYDLTRLLIGSEGTLAVITEVTLKLHPIPSHAYAVKVCFPSVKEAALAATSALREGIQLGRAEMMDDAMVKIINNEIRDVSSKWPEKVTMLFEVTGASSVSVMEQIELLRKLVYNLDGEQEMIVTDPNECRGLWMIRKECLWSTMSQYPDCEAMITDACVPLSKLPDLITITKQDIEETGLVCPILAHAGDGNVHVLIMFKPDNEFELKKAKKLAERISFLAQSLGGTCTGEHGIGTGKKELLRKEMGMGGMKLMELIKRSMDPLNILNPDKVIDSHRVYGEEGKSL